MKKNLTNAGLKLMVNGMALSVVDILQGAVDYAIITFEDIDSAITAVNAGRKFQMSVEVAKRKLINPKSVLDEINNAIETNDECKRVLGDPEYLEHSLLVKLKDVIAGCEISIESLQWCYDRQPELYKSLEDIDLAEFYPKDVCCPPGVYIENDDEEEN